MSDETDTFSFGFHTDPGPRETNQDTVLSIGLPGDRWLLAVADGMGGLAEGELASKAALKTLYKGLSEGESLAQSVRNANSVVFEEAQGRTMGTTLVAAVFHGTEADVASVGDSRAYQLDPFGLVQITRDHTLGGEVPGGIGDPASDPGPGSASDPVSARFSEALARFIGAEPTVEVDTFGPLHVQEGGWVLLSSDGLHGVLSVNDMESSLLEASDPGTAARTLVDRALAEDTPDNVSVALAFRRKGGRTEVQGDETPFRTVSRSPLKPEAESAADEAGSEGRSPEPQSIAPEEKAEGPSPEPDSVAREAEAEDSFLGPESASEEAETEDPFLESQSESATQRTEAHDRRSDSRSPETSRPWDPKQFVDRARPLRVRESRNQRTRLALRATILVILLAVFLFVVFKWTLFPGTG